MLVTAHQNISSLASPLKMYVHAHNGLVQVMAFLGKALGRTRHFVMCLRSSFKGNPWRGDRMGKCCFELVSIDSVFGIEGGGTFTSCL